MITTERTAPFTWRVTALVKDKNPSGNPWGSPFFHTRTYFGYPMREAKEMFRDSLTRDGLVIVKD